MPVVSSNVTLEVLKKASTKEVIELHREHIGPIDARQSLTARAALVRRFVASVPVCLMCGAADVTFKGWGTRRDFPTGFAPYCERHTDADKIKAVALYKFGTTSMLHSAQAVEKRKQTMIARYGVEHQSQSAEIQAKKRATFVERFGVDNPAKSRSVQAKIKRTNMDRYGHERGLSAPVVRDKIRATAKARYGHDHHFQNAEVFERFLKSAYSKGRYVTREGRELILQGYEPLIVQALEDKGWEIRKPKQTVPYAFASMQRQYHPDFVLERRGRIFLGEVKSTFTLFHKDQYAKNRAKFKAAESATAGRFLLLVYDDKQRLVIAIQNPARFKRQELRGFIAGVQHSAVRRLPCL